ncbi:hypothetical protein L3Q82_005288 [Scortum barcoo]|uniref:Uncharacterized protein n=1 Tax=Scortum barcoo TaxID=214431 RepID=A0ACB8V9Z4_9TELE|nr:hypothetical protein L3Q82_005288 [Scortum barcoo]
MMTLDVSGRVGENVTVKCSGWKTWSDVKSNVKYLCESPCNDKDIIVKAAYKKTEHKNRIELTNSADGLFVTFTNLQKSDAKKYQCRVERVGHDSFIEVNLQVTDGRVLYLMIGVIVIVATLLFLLMIMKKMMKKQPKVVSSASTPQEHAREMVKFNKRQYTTVIPITGHLYLPLTTTQKRSGLSSPARRMPQPPEEVEAMMCLPNQTGSVVASGEVRHFLQLFQGDPEGVPRPAERHSLSSVSWVFPGPPPGGTCLEHLPREASQGASETDAQATSADSSRCEGAAAFTPSSSRVTELLTLSKGAPSHPAEETHFSGHCIRNLVLSVISLSTQLLLHHDGPVHRPHNCGRCTNPPSKSISRSIFPSLMNKTPRYLNSSTLGRTSPPTQRGHATLFRSRTMASDLEVLILIPAASHSAANRLPVHMLKVLA